MNINQCPDAWAHVVGRAGSCSSCRGIVAPSAPGCLQISHGSLGDVASELGERDCCKDIVPGLVIDHAVPTWEPVCKDEESPAHVYGPPQHPQPAARAAGQQVPMLPVRVQSSVVIPELCRCSSSPGGS